MDMVSAQRRDLKNWYAAVKKLEEALLERVFSEKKVEITRNVLGDGGYCENIKSGGGFEMLRLLLDEGKKFDLSSLRGKNTVLDLFSLHPDLADNKCWQSLCPKLLTVTQKGIGEGEVMLGLILQDVNRVKDQDINASGVHAEIKNKSANIKAHGCEHNARRTTNDAAEACGWVDPARKAKNGRNLYRGLYQGLFEEEDLSIIKKYLELVYFRWDEDRVERVAAKILALDETQGSQYLGMEILSDYRECDGFELYLHIEPKTGKIVVIGDFDDKEFISEHLEFKIPLRGLSTQALADGYASVKVKK